MELSNLDDHIHTYIDVDADNVAMEKEDADDDDDGDDDDDDGDDDDDDGDGDDDDLANLSANLLGHSSARRGRLVGALEYVKCCFYTTGCFFTVPPYKEYKE